MSDSAKKASPGATGVSRRDLLALAAAALAAGLPGAALAAAPQGQLTWGVHVSLAPTWFDPAETPGIITPFMVLYALHDAMVKPMPGKALAPSLAESWTASEDGLTYEFVLRDGRQVPQRRPGHRRGRQVLVRALPRHLARSDEGRGWPRSRLPTRGMCVFKLKEPWPDFLTFYASATGAGWVVPKKYVEKVGDDGFKKAPIGAGPYKFVSFNPGRRTGVRGIRAAIGARRRASSAWCSRSSPTRRRGWPR